jgi:hypothetical protein
MGPDPAIFRALIERSPMVTYVADEAGVRARRAAS